tara:strand:- start:9581 stop:10534 length:954 start_codon:yes stop_codon:yes gene_type:complete
MNFKRKCTTYLLALFISLQTSVLYSSIKNNIIVRVGNEIVTSYELENKIKTLLFLNKEELSQNNINRVKKISLKTLIDIKLKKEELNKYNFKMNNNMVDNHLSKIALSFNINKKELEKLFFSNGINFKQYKEDLQIEFSWQQLIFQLYAKKISLEESQILEDLNLIINKNNDLEEFKLSEIEVAFEESNQKKKIINEIKDYIKNFNFEEAAVKYSLTTTALEGGNLGWINSAGMSEELLNIVKKMKIDEISKPIILTNKILFLKLIDRRIVKNPEKLDIEELKNSIIQNKKNEMLNLYANSHLSKKRNITSIKFLNE